jgi:hypothetical protein
MHMSSKSYANSSAAAAPIRTNSTSSNGVTTDAVTQSFISLQSQLADEM